MNKKIILFCIIALSNTNLFSNDNYSTIRLSTLQNIMPLKKTIFKLYPQIFDFYKIHSSNETIDLWTIYSLFHQYELVKTILLKEKKSGEYVGLIIWRHPFTTTSWEKVIQSARSLRKHELTSFIQELNSEKDMNIAEIEICSASTEEGYKKLLAESELIIAKTAKTINIRTLNNEDTNKAFIAMGYKMEQKPCPKCNRWCWQKNLSDKTTE